jgi:hypothetical protein
MSLHILATGTLVADPQKRLAKNGSEYITGQLRVPTNEEIVLIGFIAFGSEAIAALAKLGAGDVCAITGRANHEYRGELGMTTLDQPASSTALGPGEVVYNNSRGQERINLKTAVAALEREQPQVDTTNVNTMLLNQAMATQEIFARLLVMANNCTEPSIAMGYIALALKAQNLSRAALEALTEIAAPRPSPGEHTVINQPDDSGQDNDGNRAAKCDFRQTNY